MCVVSMIGDHYTKKWRDNDDYNWVQPYVIDNTDAPTKKEFNKLKREVSALRKEVKEMISLLKDAKKYDEENNEPDCEVDEKMALLRKVAKLVGIDLDAELKEGYNDI